MNFLELNIPSFNSRCTLDAALLERPGNKEIQLNLPLDYASNVKLYSGFQEHFSNFKATLAGNLAVPDSDRLLGIGEFLQAD